MGNRLQLAAATPVLAGRVSLLMCLGARLRSLAGLDMAGCVVSCRVVTCTPSLANSGRPGERYQSRGEEVEEQEKWKNALRKHKRA